MKEAKYSRKHTVAYEIKLTFVLHFYPWLSIQKVEISDYSILSDKNNLASGLVSKNFSDRKAKPRQESRPGSSRSRIPIPTSRLPPRPSSAASSLSSNHHVTSRDQHNYSPDRADSGIDIYAEFETSPTNSIRRALRAQQAQYQESRDWSFTDGLKVSPVVSFYSIYCEQILQVDFIFNPYDRGRQISLNKCVKTKKNLLLVFVSTWCRILQSRNRMLLLLEILQNYAHPNEYFHSDNQLLFIKR